MEAAGESCAVGQNKRRKDAEKARIQYSWSQTDAEVSVSFPLSTEVADAQNVRLVAKDDRCKLTLPDGRTWDCSFFREVLAEGTGFHLKRRCLILKTIKKIPNVHWQHLEVVNCKDVHELGQENVKSIPHVKHAYYEKGSNLAHVTIYIKTINKDSLRVNFQDDTVAIQFQTSDAKFLQLHPDTSEETYFSWCIQLREQILPQESDFSLTQTVLDLILKKANNKRWMSLEMPAKEILENEVVPNTWSSIKTKPATERSSKKLTPALSPQDPNRKKPTCMVPPLNKGSDVQRSTIDGLAGLDNLGNTCFMNSVLQCLANTAEFKDYFLEDLFKKDLNAQNPLGTGGTLAFAFSNFIKTLWSGKERSYAPSKLKTVIATRATQFLGYAQHDAQEFMAFLLDGLHEDLNRATTPEQSKHDVGDGDLKQDKVLADEAWRKHKSRNDSVVVDLFHGQFKSKLNCPVCNKVSITFDPFLYLSVPLPKNRRKIPIAFFPKDANRLPVKYDLEFLHDATVGELKSKVAKETSISPANLRVYEIGKGKPSSMAVTLLDRRVAIPTLASGSQIHVFEVFPEDLAGEPVVELFVFQRILIPSYDPIKCSFCKKESFSAAEKPKRCTKCFRASYCDQSCQKNHWPTHKVNCKLQPEPIGLPFLISLPESKATYANLCRLVDAHASLSVNVFQPPVTLYDGGNRVEGPDSVSRTPEESEREIAESNVANSEGSSQNQSTSDATLSLETLSPEVPQKSPAIATRAVFGQPSVGEKSVWHFTLRPVTPSGQNLQPPAGARLLDAGDKPLKLVTKFIAMDWQNYEKKSNYVLVQTKDLEFENGEKKSGNFQENDDVTLEQCLQLFAEPENLTPSDGWYCPTCKTLREASKEMSLWRLPKILIVQLKRFSFKNIIWRDKVDKTVDYPIRKLDLSPFHCGPTEETGSNLYDLYAVINHRGGIVGGHYTACARLYDERDTLQSEIEWRNFDDSRVAFTGRSPIVSPDAYLLFYRQRTGSRDESVPVEESSDVI